MSIFADRDAPGWRQRERRRLSDLDFLTTVRAMRAAGDLEGLRGLSLRNARKNDPAWKRVAANRSIAIVLGMKFDRRLRLLEAIARAGAAIAEAMAIALEVDADEGEPEAETIPPAAPSEASDTRFQSLPPAVKAAPDPKVDTLSTSHANPGEVRRVIPERETRAGFHAFDGKRALEELRKGHAQADTVEKQLRISNVARVLISQGLIDEAEVEEILRPSQRP